MAILVDMTELDKKREAISSTARYYSSKANTFTYSSFNSSYCSKMSNYLSGINEIYKDISKNLYSASSYLASYLIDIRNVESKYKKIPDVTIHKVDNTPLFIVKRVLVSGKNSSSIITGQLKELKDLGLSNLDVYRVMNGEISIADLADELCSNLDSKKELIKKYYETNKEEYDNAVNVLSELGFCNEDIEKILYGEASLEEVYAQVTPTIAEGISPMDFVTEEEYIRWQNSIDTYYDKISSELDSLNRASYSEYSSSMRGEIFGNPWDKWEYKTVVFARPGEEPREYTVNYFNGLWSNGVDYVGPTDDAFKSYLSDFKVRNANVVNDQGLEVAQDIFYAIILQDYIQEWEKFLSSDRNVPRAAVNEYYQEELGMSEEEYLYRVNALTQDKLTIESYDYSVRQRLKECPYLEMQRTDEYQAWLQNQDISAIKNEILNRKSSLPEYDIDNPGITMYNSKINDTFKDSLEYLEDDEILFAYYLLTTENESKTIEYLEAIKDKINQRMGKKQAEEFLEKLATDSKPIATLQTFFQGFGDGVETFGEGLENVLSADGVMTDNNYEAMYIIQGLTSNRFNYINELLAEMQKTNPEKAQEISQAIISSDGSVKMDYARSVFTPEQCEILQNKIDQDKLGEDWLTDVYNAGSGVGNMAIPVATSIVLNALCPMAGIASETAQGTIQTISLAMVGTSAGGNARNQALIDGKSEGQAWAIGLWSGLSEVALEKVLGGIEGLADDIGNPFISILKEGSEEFVQEYMDRGAVAAIDFISGSLEGKDTNTLINETITSFDGLSRDSIKSFIYGCCSTILLNGGTSLAYNTIKVSVNGQAMSLADYMNTYGEMSDEEYYKAVNQTPTQISNVNITYDQVLQKINESGIKYGDSVVQNVVDKLSSDAKYRAHEDSRTVQDKINEVQFLAEQGKEIIRIDAKNVEEARAIWNGVGPELSHKIQFNLQDGNHVDNKFFVDELYRANKAKFAFEEEASVAEKPQIEIVKNNIDENDGASTLDLTKFELLEDIANSDPIQKTASAATYVKASIASLFDKDRAREILQNAIKNEVNPAKRAKLQKSLTNLERKSSINYTELQKDTSNVTSYQAAILFNDVKQYLISILYANIDVQSANNIISQMYDSGKTAAGNINLDQLYQTVSQYMSQEQISYYEYMKSQQVEYSDVEQALAYLFTDSYGPILSAYYRNAVVNYKTAKYDGTDINKVFNYLWAAINHAYDQNKSNNTLAPKIWDLMEEIGFFLVPENMPLATRKDIVNNIAHLLEGMIEKSPALQQNIIVKRGVNELFFNGQKITTLEVGTIFNDSAQVSTSVTNTNMVNNHDIILEIELPKGTKGLYIEPLAGIGSIYSQQEFVLPPNCQFMITDQYQYYDGKIHIKCRLIQQGDKTLYNNHVITSTKYFEQYIKAATGLTQAQILRQISSEQFYNSIDWNIYNRELAFSNEHGLYNDYYANHGIDHVSRVLQNALSLSALENLSQRDIQIVSRAAIMHDMAATSEEYNAHGERGGIAAYQLLSSIDSGFTSDEIGLISAIIEMHETHDTKLFENNSALFKSVCQKYGIDQSQYERTIQLMNILKDADAVDRIRFSGLSGGMLNVKYLRTESAVTIIKAASENIEYNAKNILDNALSNSKLSLDVREKILNMRQEGYSDYSILFNINYGNLYAAYKLPNESGIVKIDTSNGDNGTSITQELSPVSEPTAEIPVVNEYKSEITEELPVINDNSIPASESLLNNSSLKVQKVGDLNMNQSIISKAFNRNAAYIGYDFVVTSKLSFSQIVDEVIKSNEPNSKILIEIDNTTDLTDEAINKLPDNVNVRIIGSYTQSFLNTFRLGDDAVTSLRNVTYTKEELLKINSILTEFDSQVNPEWNKLEKAKFAYDYLSDRSRIQYHGETEYEGNNQTRPKRYSSLTGLIEGASTCQGFAHIYQALCQRMGIECYELSGVLTEKDIGTKASRRTHAFNAIVIDSNTLLVDTVRKDQKAPYNIGTGFGVKNISQYHIKSNQQIGETDLNKYIDQNGNLQSFNKTTSIIFPELNQILNIYVDSFKNLPVQEKAEIIKKCNLFDLDSIDALLSQEPSLKGIVEERLIAEQNSIIAKVSTSLIGLGTFYLEYIANRPELLSKLNTSNLSLLAALTSRSEIPQPVIDELTARVSNGELIFATPSLNRCYHGAAFNDMDRVANMFSEQNPDGWKQLITNFSQRYKSTINPNFKKIINPLPLSIYQRLQIALLSKADKINDSSIHVLEKMLENPTMIQSLDFNMLASDIINDFGEEFVINIARFKNLTMRLTFLKENHPHIYEAYKTLMNRNMNSNSLLARETIISSTLDFMFEYADYLGDIDDIDLDSLQEYILTTRILGNDANVGFSNNFIGEYRALLDERVNGIDKSSSTAIDDYKDAYFKKYYSMSLESAKVLCTKYGTNLEEMRKDGNHAGQVLHDIMFVLETKTFDSIANDYGDTLGEIYEKQSEYYTATEMLNIGDHLHDWYIQSYQKAFAETIKEIENSNHRTIDVNGKDVTIVNLKKPFSFLVYSSDTGISLVKKKITSFIEAFKNVRNGQAHALSSSFITQENIGTVSVGDAGVLYGFVDASKIKVMGAQDINSNIADYGFETKVKQQFITASQMSKYTTRCYNEFIQDRNNLTPDYIILLSDASEAVRQNSLSAAAEWNIPVIEIDVKDLATNQINEVNNLLSSFKETGNIEYLKQAIEKYEAGASGFNINIPSEEMNKRTNIHESVRSIFESCPIIQMCQEYLQEIIDLKDIDKLCDYRDILEKVQSRFENTNNRDRVVTSVAKTKSMIDISAMLTQINNYFLTNYFLTDAVGTDSELEELRNLIYRAFVKYIPLQKGDVPVSKVIQNINAILRKRPDFHFIADSSINSQSVTVDNKSYISINLKRANPIDVFHELGHNLYDTFLPHDSFAHNPEVTEIMNKAREKIQERAEDVYTILDEAYHAMEACLNETTADRELRENLQKKGIEKFEKAFDEKGDLKKEIKMAIDNHGLQDLLRLLNVTENDIDAIANNYTAAKNVYVYGYMNDAVNRIGCMNFQENYMAFYILTGMINSITQKTQFSFGDKSINLVMTHENNYWTNYGRDADMYSLNELVAQYMEIGASGKSKIVNTLRSIVGDELVDYLDSIYSKILEEIGRLN